MVGRRTTGGRHQDGSGLASVRLGGRPKLKIVGGNGGEASIERKKKVHHRNHHPYRDTGILLSDSEEMVLPNPVEMAKWARR